MRQDAYRGEIVGKRGVRQVDGRFNNDRGLCAQDRISHEIQLEPVCFMDLEPGFCTEVDTMTLEVETQMLNFEF